MPRRKPKVDDTRRGEMPGVCTLTLASYERRLAKLHRELSDALRAGKRADVAGYRAHIARIQGERDEFLLRATWGER